MVEEAGATRHGLDERLPVHEGVHRAHRARAAEQRGEIRAELGGHAGVQEEAAHVGRLRVEHLGDQVLADVGGLLDHRRHVVGRVVPAHQRPGREPQPGRPPAEPLVQVVDVTLAELDAHRLQQVPGLVVGEGEVGRPDLQDRVAEPVPVQRQDRVDASDEDDAEPSQRVAEQLVHLARHGHRRQLVAVDDEGQPLRSADDQPGQGTQPQAAQPTGRRDGPARRHAQTVLAQRRQHRLPEEVSPSSNATQQTAPSGSARAQSATASVFPAPAGALTRTSGTSADPASALKRWGRGTCADGGSGMP